MNRLPYFLICLFFSFSSFSQSESNKIIAVKMYNMSTIDNEFVNPFLSISHELSQYFRPNQRWFQPTLAIQWGKTKKRKQEFEVTHLVLNNSDAPSDNFQGGGPFGGNFVGEQRFRHFAIRYEYMLNLSQNQKKIVQPYIGLGAMPYFIRNTQIPILRTHTKYQETFSGFFTFFTPRLEFQIKDYLGIDLNIPIALTNWFEFHEASTNETYPDYNRIRTDRAFNRFPNYLSFRLGISVVI